MFYSNFNFAIKEQRSRAKRGESGPTLYKNYYKYWPNSIFVRDYRDKSSLISMKDLYSFENKAKIKANLYNNIHTMTDYPPYINAYGQLPRLFKRIREADVPPRFTQDFLSSVLEMKSSSHRPMIPFLKRIGFLDSANTPTKAYREYRDEELGKFVMAEQIKKSYQDLYKAHEYAHTLNKDNIVSKLSSVLGIAKNDKTLPVVASTFLELCKLADFKGLPEKKEPVKVKEKEGILQEKSEGALTIKEEGHRLGISYTINLNLPPATDQKVFDAIFKSLKEHLLK